MGEKPLYVRRISRDKYNNGGQLSGLFSSQRILYIFPRDRLKSTSTETKEIHNIAISGRKYISHLVGQHGSLLYQIELLESKSEELAVLKINKIQVERDLGDSRGLCDPMSREFDGLNEFGKENIKRSASRADLFISLDAHIE